MVVALAGRRIDAPDADAPRFPAANEAAVRARIEAVLQENGATVLVGSAACGADLIAQEAAIRLGVQCHVVLPFSIEEFREASVTDRPGDWGPRFDHVIHPAHVVLLGFDREDEEAYRKTNVAILDEAASLGETTAVIVWDGQSRGSSDYTAHFRSEAASRRMPVIEIRTI